MSAAPRPRLRAALQLAAFAVVAWLLAQGCTLLWQAAQAADRDARVALGQPLYAWEFSDPAAVVAPGSEGLAEARHAADGLHAGEGAAVLDLSLALDGRPVAGQAYAAARLVLGTAVPARVRLLAPGSHDTEVATVALAAVAPGHHELRLALAPFASAAGWLRLRVERDAPGALVVHSLALVEPRCALQPAQAGALPLPAECGPQSAWVLQPAWAPEGFLAARDAALVQAPAARLEVAGVPRGLAGVWGGLHAGWVHGLALVAAALVLGWSLRERWIARMAGSYGGVAGGIGFRQPGPQEAACGERVAAADGRGGLVVLLAVPVLLLLAGQPDRHDHPLVVLALLASFAAALLHPGGRSDWRWVGGSAAWGAAARLTAIGIVLLGLLVLLGFALGESPGNWRTARLPRYLAWALLQQALLLVAIMPRLVREGRDPRLAAVAAGGVFALLHLPNFGLALATLLAGSAWALQGHRHGALLPLALSHAVLGTLLVWAASPWLLRSAEVGGRFLMPG